MAQTKQFKVAAVSDNTNSFGLYGVVLVARDGQAFEVGKSMYGATPLWPLGHVLTLEVHKGNFNFAARGIEIPRQLPTAPPKLIKALWD